MFRFWFRELVGWLLVGIGLCIFAFCLWSLTQTPVPGTYGLLEAPIGTVIGIFIFRGGIHLLKIAVAARLSLRVHDEVRKQKADQPKQGPDTPWDW